MVRLLINWDFIQRNHLYFFMVNSNLELVGVVFFDQFFLAWLLEVVVSYHYLLLPLLVKLLELDHFELLFVLIFELELVYVNLPLLQLLLPPLMPQSYRHSYHLLVIDFKIRHFDAQEVLMLSQLAFLNVKFVLVVVNSFHLVNYQIHFDQHRHFELRHFCLFEWVFSYYSKLVIKFHFHHFKEKFLIHLAFFLF